MDQLDVIYTGPESLLLCHLGFYVDQLDVIYTRLDRSFIVPSGILLVAWAFMVGQ